MEGKQAFFKLVRMRTVLYAAIIAVVGGIMLYTLATRDSEGISVIHDRNPMFVRLSDGALRNGYTIRIVNKQLKYRDFIVSVDGLPSTLVDFVGLPPRADGRQLIDGRPRPDQGSARRGDRLQRHAAGALDLDPVQADRHRFRRDGRNARSLLRAVKGGQPMSALLSKPRELTGKHVLFCLLGFFGVVFAVNAVLVKAATSTFGGVETVELLQGRPDVRAGRRQARSSRTRCIGRSSGKLARDSAGEAVLDISARDAKGAPLAGLTAQARLAHPADERLDHVIALEPHGRRPISWRQRKRSRANGS